MNDEGRTKPYRVRATIQNNRLWSAIRREFPDVRTQKQAADCLQMLQTQLGRYLNMVEWPGAPEVIRPCGQHFYRDGWTLTAWRIADRLRETPDYLFDLRLYGRQPKVIDVAIESSALVAAGLIRLEPPPDDVVARKEAAAAMAPWGVS